MLGNDTNLDLLTFELDSGEEWQTTLPEELRDLIWNCYYIAEAGNYELEKQTVAIKTSLLSFVPLGIQLYQVQKFKLWKNRYDSFGDYCKRALGRAVWECKKYIESARICISLLRQGFTFLPKNVSQCWELRKLTDEELGEKWREICDRFPPAKITADIINHIVSGEDDKPKRNTIKATGELAAKLAHKAASLGISVTKLVSKLFDDEVLDEEKTEVVEQEKLEEWEKDLEELVDKENSEEHNQCPSENNMKSTSYPPILPCWQHSLNLIMALTLPILREWQEWADTIVRMVESE